MDPKESLLGVHSLISYESRQSAFWFVFFSSPLEALRALRDPGLREASPRRGGRATASGREWDPGGGSEDAGRVSLRVVRFCFHTCVHVTCSDLGDKVRVRHGAPDQRLFGTSSVDRQLHMDSVGRSQRARLGLQGGCCSKTSLKLV